MSTAALAIHGTTTERKAPRRKAKKLTMSTTQVSNLGRYITIAMGCGIPLLSLSLSHVGGHLLSVGLASLGTLAMALCLVVLGVSLSHLAWAIGDITKSPAWANWALAIAVDLSMVLAELVKVFGGSEGIEALRLGLMIAVTLASMVLNCWAFLSARHGTGKIVQK